MLPHIRPIVGEGIRTYLLQSAQCLDCCDRLGTASSPFRIMLTVRSGVDRSLTVALRHLLTSLPCHLISSSL